MATKCNRIEIDVTFFEDRLEPTPFLIHFYPMTKEFYMQDSFNQGGVMLKYAFKQRFVSTLGKVIEVIEEVMRDAAKEDIGVSILRNSHNMKEGNEWRNKCSGIIYFNGKYLSRNRQLNDSELDIIYNTLKINLNDLYPKE